MARLGTFRHMCSHGESSAGGDGGARRLLAPVL